VGKESRSLPGVQAIISKHVGLLIYTEFSRFILTLSSPTSQEEKSDLKKSIEILLKSEQQIKNLIRLTISTKFLKPTSILTFSRRTE